MITQEHVDKKGGVNPLAAAVAGIVVGAGVAVAGAVALNDENNRKNIKKSLISMKGRAMDFIEENKKHAQVKKVEVAKKINESKEKIEDVAMEAKDALSQETKGIIDVAEKSV